MKTTHVPMILSLNNSSDRRDIDGLRGVAIILVVLYHLFPKIFLGGFNGVDIFFVISGYVITLSIHKALTSTSISFYQFYSARIKRLFPGIILVLTSLYIFSWFYLTSSEFKELGQKLALAASFSSNLQLETSSNYFDELENSNLLTHMWSLGIEWQFYVFIIIFLCYIWKWGYKIFPLTLVLACLSLYYFLAHQGGKSAENFYYPQYRFWELLAGSALATISELLGEVNPVLKKMKIFFSGLLLRDLDKSNTQGIKNSMGVLGFILILTGLINIDKNQAISINILLFPVLGTLLLLSAGKNCWINRNIFSRSFFVWFGLISYSLYLWHWILICLYKIIYAKSSLAYFEGFSIFSLAVFFSWISTKFIESPIRRSATTLPKILLLISYVCGLIILGICTNYFDGFPERKINKELIGVNNGLSYNWKEEFRYGKCFLDGITVSKFSELCSTTEYIDRPTVFLWGDSYAASLYRGFLENSTKSKFNLTQLTTSGCPPLIDFDVATRPSCVQINKGIVEKIRLSKPQTVVMGAYWGRYNGENDVEKLNYESLKKTFEVIKSFGVKNIILIGQLPTYKTKAPYILRREMMTRPDNNNFGLYRSTNNDIYLNMLTIDRELNKIASESGIGMISPISMLCNDSGCEISSMNPDGVVSPLSFDKGHLTTFGSEFIVDKFFKSSSIF